MLLISTQAKYAILRPDTCIVSSLHQHHIGHELDLPSQINGIFTQDMKAICPSIHADCIGVFGFGVRAWKGAAGGPETADEGTPETPEIEVFFCLLLSHSTPGGYHDSCIPR